MTATLHLRKEHARICHLIRIGSDAVGNPLLDKIGRRQVRQQADRNMNRLAALMAAMPESDRVACGESHALAADRWRAIMETAMPDDELANRVVPPVPETGETWQPPY